MLNFYTFDKLEKARTYIKKTLSLEDLKMNIITR